MVINDNGNSRFFLDIAKKFDCNGMFNFFSFLLNIVILYISSIEELMNKIALIYEYVHGVYSKLSSRACSIKERDF